MNIMEKYARYRAARQMGLVNDPDGLNLPDDLWKQYHEGREPFRFSYTNYRGETGDRQVVPIGVRFGDNNWHQEPQWLMLAFDLDKWANREFAMMDMHPCASI